jgi:hypothetical protein
MVRETDRNFEEEESPLLKKQHGIGVIRPSRVAQAVER